MHAQPHKFTLLMLAIASMACLPGADAQEQVGSTQADNPSPSRWAPYQSPLWQPLALARADVPPLGSPTTTARMRDNVRRQLVRTHHPVDAKLKQLEFDYIDLGAMMAAAAVRADADYHRPQLSQLDSELEQVANRVLGGAGYVSQSSGTVDKIVVPAFIAFESQLDATTAELTSEVENELRASDQRVFELRHEPASGPATSTPQTNSAGRVSQRPLKATLTDDDVQRLAKEFNSQRTLLRLKQRLSPVTLGRAAQRGYLQYLQRMLVQDKQVLSAIRGVEWNQQLREVVEIERAITEKIGSLAETTSADGDQLLPGRYAVIRTAVGGAGLLE